MSKELNKAPVEQAGGDERDLQGTQGERDGWGPFPIVQVPWNVFDRAVMWVEDRRRYGDDGTIVDDWKALKTIQRAALAQPSPVLPPFAEKVLAKLRRFYDCASDFESGGVDIGRHWLDLLTQLGLLNRVQRSPALWEITQQGEDLLGTPQPSPAQAEQAEVERPEVVGYRVSMPDEPELGHWLEEEAESEPQIQHHEPLMTVAQHAASVARWAEMFNRVEQERDAANARLHEVVTACATAEQERDAALARVAELELKLDQSDYAYDNDRHHMRGMAKQAAEAIQVFTGHDSGANLAHRYGEKWWEHLDELRDALLAFAKNAPPAQAQHSVPEGWMLVECGIWTQEQVDEMQKTVARFRNSEFVDDRALAMAVADAGQCKAPEISLAELLAAAPGKEG
ncbi:TPA: hypothetical protein NIJ97_002009 [Pseudomonas aeruginosa]|nr:hypothetical protein [Pseudomonas aeruginosa]